MKRKSAGIDLQKFKKQWKISSTREPQAAPSSDPPSKPALVFKKPVVPETKEPLPPRVRPTLDIVDCSNGRTPLQPIPEGFLYTYQQRAVNRFAKNSGLVCFRMGLGKTMTELGVVHSVFYRNKDAPPALLVGPRLALDILHADLGKLKARGVEMHLVLLESSSVVAMKSAHIVFCTYSTLARTWGSYVKPSHGSKTRLKRDVQAWLWESEHSIVVLDEAHTICNRDTSSYKAAMALKTNHRLGLTGTPILNSAEDVVSLRKWLRFPEDADIRDMIVSETHETVGEELGHDPVTVHEYQLTSGFENEGERAVHRMVLDKLAERLELDTRQPEDMFSDPSSDLFQKSQMERFAQPSTNIPSVFAALTRARQACLVPALVDSNLESERWATTHSTKINLLAHYLRTYDGRVVIMTFFVSAFPYIRKRIEMEGLGKLLEYHGGLKERAREEILCEWRRHSGKPGGPRFLLATIGAAGVSLNLQSERIVILEPMYNPQRQRQAEFRVIRMDGLREVTITRMLITGSIEECIARLAKEKAEMAQRLLGSRGRLNTANISRHILRPLRREHLRQTLGMRDEEALAKLSRNEVHAELQHLMDSDEFIRNELDDMLVSRIEARVDRLIEAQGKNLAHLTGMDFSRIMVVDPDQTDTLVPVLYLDESMECMGMKRVSWAVHAYEQIFVCFEYVEQAIEWFSEALGKEISNQAEALGQAAKELFEEKPVGGLWFTLDEKVVLFSRDLLQE